MGIHFPQKRYRARRRGHSRPSFARSSQLYLLAFLVALPVIFCTLFVWDKGFASQSRYEGKSPQSWMLGGREAIAPEDSSAEATDQGEQFGSLGTNRAATRFSLCHTGGGGNCVVDGDTFWCNGQKIRIADIDTPETHPARCAAEAELGGGGRHGDFRNC